MADVRRVEFQTISAPKDTNRETKCKPVTRFTLTLSESTSTTCPEFSFIELMKKEKGESEADVSLIKDQNDPFADEERLQNEVAALAKKFEEKYKPGKKRQPKCLEDENYWGDGYDESDTFIDNTEAYDEALPSGVTTKHGGFYINHGTLDLKVKSDAEDSGQEFVTPRMKKRGRPRKIIDSDEEGLASEGEPQKKKKKKKLDGTIEKDGEKAETAVEKIETNGVKVEKKKHKKLFGPDGVEIVKKKKLSTDKKKKMSELLKQQTASTATKGSSDSPCEDSQHESPINNLGGPVQERSEEAVNNSMQDGDKGKANGTEDGQNQLPSDLPSDLYYAIDDIKKAASDTKEGKCKFFTNHVNKLLLDIELASRQLQSGRRSAVYAHLADHLPCGKETLIKRAKKLRENQQDDQLKVPIQKLKEEIEKLMPSLQEQHDQEVAKARQELKEKEGQEVREDPPNTESDDEDKTDTKGRKGNRDPRKKFKWTPEIKTLLHQIVTVKMHMFDTYKFRNQTAEEYLRTFLENEIKVLWPQGWIQTRMLYKETRAIHGKWTNLLKAKRPVLVTSRTPASPTPASSAATDQPASDVQPAQPTPNIPQETEVIEIDSDEVLSPAPPPKDHKPLDGVQKPRPLDNLKFSSKTVETMAATTAAMLAATMSPHGDFIPPHSQTITEAMRRAEGTSPSGYHKASPPSSQPKTPPAAAKDAYMAEFNRYISSNSNSAPSSHSQVSGQSSQTQSMTAPLSTGRDSEKPQQQHRKGMSEAQIMQLATERAHRLAAQAHVEAYCAAAAQASQMSNREFMNTLFEQMTGHYQKQDSKGGGLAKSRSTLAQEQILSKIEAENDASNSRHSSASGSKFGASFSHEQLLSKVKSEITAKSASSSKLSLGNVKQMGDSQGKQAAPVNVMPTISSSSNFVSGNTSKHLLTPPPAHSSTQPTTSSSHSLPNSSAAHFSNVQSARQLPATPLSSASSLPPRTSPGTMRTVQSRPVAGKQQAVVPPRPALGRQGQQGSAAATVGVRSPGTFHSPHQQNPSPAGRASAPSLPGLSVANDKRAAMSASAAMPSTAHAAQPFQRSPGASAPRPPGKVTLAHSQGMKVMPGQGQGAKVMLGQGQGTKVTAGQSHLSPNHQRIAGGPNMQQRVSASGFSMQGALQQTAAKTVMKTVTALSQSEMRQLENEVNKAAAAVSSMPSSRSSPCVSRMSGSHSAPSQSASSQVVGPNASSGSMHAKPPAFTNTGVSTAPFRPPEPSSAVAAGFKPPTSSGVATAPPVPGTVARPQGMDAPRLPPSPGQ